jgi:ABC-type dipeptide/oligopeptide/nickel transport system ATPase component
MTCASPRQICDDVAVMQRGRVVEQGPAAEVLTNPQQAYTRALLDARSRARLGLRNFRRFRKALGRRPSL